MKLLKKFRHSVMTLALIGALTAPVIAQAATWICYCEITDEYWICVCFPEKPDAEIE